MPLYAKGLLLQNAWGMSKHTITFATSHCTILLTSQGGRPRDKKEYYRANKIGKKSTASAVAAVLLVREFVREEFYSQSVLCCTLFACCAPGAVGKEVIFVLQCFNRISTSSRKGRLSIDYCRPPPWTRAIQTEIWTGWDPGRLSKKLPTAGKWQ